MKKAFAALLVIVAMPASAQSWGNYLRVEQRDPTDIAWQVRLFPPPPTDSLYFFNASTIRPQMLPLGSSLQVVGGALEAIGSTQVFNYGDPVTRTIVPSTAYQATDPSKAADFSISPQCTNTTTVIASSACTVQVRQGTSGLTCSTGTVTKQWVSTVPLGLAFTQTSGGPIEIKLGAGRYFILCPTAGTFTVPVATDQVAGL